MHRILTTIFMFGLLALSDLRAQNGEYWEEVPGPYGGRAYEVVSTTNGKLYAQMSRGDVYRSDDQGATWKVIDSLNFSFFIDVWSFFIGKSGTFYALSSDAWYRSENEGATWAVLNPAPINAAPFEAQLAQIVESANGILTGYANGQLFYSEDKGETWLESNVPSSIPYSEPKIRQLQNGDIIVGPPESYQANSIYKFYRSIDDGRTWSEYQLEFPISFGYPLSYSPLGAVFLFAEYTPIYRSPGSGAPFVVVPCDSLPNFPTPFFPYSQDLTALPSGRLLKTESYHMLYSDDDGLSWHLLEGYNLDGSNHGSSYLLTNTVLASGKLFMIRGNSGIYSSEDEGLTWSFSSQNIRCANIWEMAFETDSLFYAVAPSGLWKTENQGNTWQQLTNPLSEFGQINRGGDFEHYMYLDKPNRLITSENGHLILSANGGNTFEDITPVNFNNNYPNIGDAYINPVTKDLYASYFRSLDSGITWQFSQHPRWMLRMPSGEIFGLSQNQFQSSVNEGDTWETQAIIPGINWSGRLKAAPDGTLYFIGFNYVQFSKPTAFLFKSEDGGQSWIKLAIPPIVIPPSSWDTKHFFEITQLGHLIFATYNKIFLSLNKGTTWQSQPDLPNNFGYGKSIVSLALSSDQYLHVYNGLYLFKSRSPISTGTYLRGSVLKDADADCNTAGAIEPLKNWVVEAANAGDSYYTISDSLGQYEMFLDTGFYIVKVKSPNVIWWEACESPKTFQADSLFNNDTLNFSALALANCALMSMDVSIPVLRRCFDNNAYFQYCNVGSEPADSAWADITLDPYLSLQSCPLPYNALGNNVFRIALGHLDPGDCGQFNLVVHVNCDSTVLGQTHCISARAFPDTLCTTLPNWSGANIEAEVHCQDTSIQLLLRNTGTAASQILEYVIIEDDVVLMYGQESYAPAEQFSLNFPPNGHTWRIESDQEPGHPFSLKAIAFAEGCGGFESLGFVNQFSVNGVRPSVDRECRENVGSYDPNDKQGFPLGVGPEHQIRPGQELEYLIRFQNTGTDTAFTVVIRDTLSAFLDPATIQAGASSHPYSLELSKNGILSFIYSPIALPDSNTNLVGSQGFISFRVQQRNAIPLESVIYNQAGIFFDFNEPILTNQTWHTVTLPTVATSSPGLLNQHFDVMLSPNPVSRTLFLESKSSPIRRVEISSADGSLRQVLELGNTGRQVQIGIEKLPAGTYFARVFCEEGVVVKKFVVAR